MAAARFQTCAFQNSPLFTRVIGKYMKNSIVIRIYVALLISLLSACGGGGSSSPSSVSGSSPATTPGCVAPEILLNGTCVTPPAVVDSTYENIVQQLYIAFFGRPADPAGLAIQSQAFRAASAPSTIVELSGAYASSPAVRKLVDSFASSPESNQLYYTSPYLGRGFVPAVYDNVFSHAPAAASANYWNGLLLDGQTARSSVVVGIIAGAQGSDAALFARKVQVATQFTRTLDAAGQRATYDNPASKLVVAAMIHSVPSMADESVIQASMDAVMRRLSALSTGRYVEAPAGARNIVLLASTDQLSSNGALVSDLAGALTSDLNGLRLGGPTWKVSIMTAAGTVAAIRDQLRAYDGAILIGRVPVATASGSPRLDVYRLPNCPLLQVDGTGEVSSFSTVGVDPRCKNGLIISILRGQSPQTELGDVARKLDQMIAYHKTSAAKNTSWAQRLIYVEGGWFGGPDVHQAGQLDAWAGMTMFPQYAISYLDVGTSAPRRDAFVDCITHNNEICGANLHGSPTLIQFEGPGTLGVFYSSDSLNLIPSTLAAQSVQAKYITLDSCNTQNFLVDQSVGTTLLMNGSTLLTRGNVDEAWISNHHEEDAVRNEYALLQNGSTFAEALYGRMETTPDNVQGDPYITMRRVPQGAQPKLVIEGTHYNSGVTALPINLPDSVNGSSLIQVVTYSNRGDADLHLRVGLAPTRIGVDTGLGFQQLGSDGSIFSVDFTQTFSDGRVLAWPAFVTETYGGAMHATIKPGQSVAVTYRMNVPVKADGTPQSPGQYAWDQVNTSDDPASGRVVFTMMARVR